MKALLLSAALLCLGVSCSSIPTPVPNKDGSAARANIVAGKGMLTYNADGSMQYTFQQEKSWQHTMQAATSLGLSYIGYLDSLAKEVTARFQAGQITIQQRDAAFASLEQARIAAGVSGATQFNPNIALPIRQ